MKKMTARETYLWENMDWPDRLVLAHRALIPLAVQELLNYRLNIKKSDQTYYVPSHKQVNDEIGPAAKRLWQHLVVFEDDTQAAKEFLLGQVTSTDLEVAHYALMMMRVCSQDEEEPSEHYPLHILQVALRTVEHMAETADEDVDDFAQ